MTKKIILTITFILFALFASTYSFATDNMKNGAMDAANGVRNAVGDVENGVEDTAKDISGAIRKSTNDVEKAGNDVTGDIKSSNNKDNHPATRTATDVGTGMSNTMWIWLIMAIVAVAIIALIWFYTAQNKNNRDY